MTRDEIIATLRAHESILRGRGVRHAALFGSAARGEATPDSDIDILIDLEPRAPIGLPDEVRNGHHELPWRAIMGVGRGFNSETHKS